MGDAGRIPLFKVLVAPEAKALLGEVLDSGYLGQGSKVRSFEEALQKELGLSARPLATNSCTSALDIAYHLCGIGPDSIVISTPVTCTATNSQLVTRGARILWADVDPQTGLIDPIHVESLCRKHPVEAIVAVDWAGASCDYGALRRNGPPVIQDAAHRYLPAAVCPVNGFRNDRPPLECGDYVAWSFQAIKHLTCGDGGALQAPARDAKLAELLRWYGLDRESAASFRCSQTIPIVGFKYHMNDVAAAIGLANMAGAQISVLRHRQNVQFLLEHLRRLDFKVRPALPCQPDKENDFEIYGSAHWIFCVLVDDQDGFIKHLDERGIDASPVHARNDKHPQMRGWKWRRLPGVDEFCSREVAIPCGWWLTDEDRRRIREALEAWVTHKGS